LKLYDYAAPLDSGGVTMSEESGLPDTGEEGPGRTALVADIFTSVSNTHGDNVLYEANGQYMLMLALVGNERSPRLVTGVVFSHYEFLKPLDRRMTDQEWQGVVYKGQGEMPPKNFWYDALMPGKK